MASGKIEESKTQSEAAEQLNSVGKESAIPREKITQPEFKTHSFPANGKGCISLGIKRRLKTPWSLTTEAPPL